jgi:hypothetical protein
MSQTPAPGQQTPNPAVVAFFRSTTWKLLIAADILAVAAGVAFFYFTNNFLSFIPLALVGGLMTFSLVRVIKSGAAPASGGDDPIVR